jgi:hypothetical protein
MERQLQSAQSRLVSRYASGSNPDTLADVLERILDKGIVIVGDVVINILDIELLTLKVRLVVASVDTAKRMGIDWWTMDPFLNSRAKAHELKMENHDLRLRLEKLEKQIGPAADDAEGGS